MTVSSAQSLDDRLTALFAAEPDALAGAPALYRDLREQAPVHAHEAAVLFSRHADARTLVRDELNLGKSEIKGSDTAQGTLARMPEDARKAYERVAAFENLQLTLADHAEHDRLRGIMHRAMTPRRIASFEASVQRYSDDLLEPLREQEVADVMQFAYMLPLMVICDLLGIPQADRELIHGWSTAIGRNKGAIPYAPVVIDADRAIREFREYLQDRLAEHRRTPQSTDLLAALMAAEGDDRLTTDELASNFVMLLFAGHETTTNLIGIGLLELLRQRDQWQLLCDQPELAPRAVEELLRYVTPVQWNNRVALRDFEYGGIEIPRGRLVFSVLAAANRDPDAFPDPERVDIMRDTRGHLALGIGAHFCLGASLTRLEGRVAFETLARRFPDMQLADEAIGWRGSALLRSPDRLPIALGPER